MSVLDRFFAWICKEGETYNGSGETVPQRRARINSFYRKEFEQEFSKFLAMTREGASEAVLDAALLYGSMSKMMISSTVIVEDLLQERHFTAWIDAREDGKDKRKARERPIDWHLDGELRRAKALREVGG